MKKTVEDFSYLYEKEQKKNDLIDDDAKEDSLEIWLTMIAIVLTLLLTCTIFTTSRTIRQLTAAVEELQMITERSYIKSNTSNVFDDPYYQGNADIGGGMNDDLAPGSYGSDPEGNDYCSVSDPQLQYEPYDSVHFTIDSGNSESETVEGSQHQPRIPGPKPTPKPNPDSPTSINK